MNAIDLAGANDTAGIKEMAVHFLAHLTIGERQPDTFVFAALELRCDRSFRGLNGRWRHDQYRGYGHARLNRCAADGGYQRQDAL